jgi:tetratricopeptide (TPR) repeat protein
MLDAARQGLAIDPDDDACANFQAMALTKLGRQSDADATIERALERNPENAYTHANRGWTLLEQGDHPRALDHFREALRIDPTLDWARQGIVEALKARYFLYRVMLKFFFWMSRLSTGVQWGIIIGGLVGQRVLNNLAANNPPLRPFVWPILGAYFAFVLMTWLASPLFNLLLRLNRYGRLALSREQVATSNWVGSMLVAAFACVAGALACFLAEQLLFAAGIGLLGLVFVLVTLPLSTIFVCDVGWPRTIAILMTVALAGLGVAPAALLLAAAVAPQREALQLASLALPLLPVFFYSAIGTQIAANFLAVARVRR